MEGPQLNIELNADDFVAFLEGCLPFDSSPSRVQDVPGHHPSVIQVLYEGAMGTATVDRMSAEPEAVEDAESLKAVQAKREHRKKQKRDYAKRKRTKEKQEVVLLEERQKQLRTQKEDLKEHIKQLTANLAVYKVFMPLHKNIGCKVPKPQDQKPPLSAAGADSTCFQTDVLPQGSSSSFPDGLSMSKGQGCPSAQDDLDTQGDPNHQGDLAADDNLDSSDSFDLLGFFGDETSTRVTLHRLRKSASGEDYSAFSGDFYSFDFPNRAPIPPSQEENADSATSPAATNPQQEQFWIS